jgi:hypothetical protein
MARSGKLVTVPVGDFGSVTVPVAEVERLKAANAH